MIQKYYRIVALGILYFFFSFSIQANEGSHSFRALNAVNDDYYWNDPLKKIKVEYLRGLEAYASKDYEVAYDIWLPMAQAGFSYAQTDIAGLYFNGWGIDKNYETAYLWYKKAAITQNTYAQYMMGNIYWNGYGVKIQTDIAQVWWKLAADKGYKDAQFALPYQYCYLNHPEC